MSNHAVTVPVTMVEEGHRVNDSMVVTRVDNTADGKYYIELAYEYAFGQAKAASLTMDPDSVLIYDVEVD